ncbi:hypothetical protein QTP70_007945 [Hemibagrus guttatus]|uniref:Transposase Tc1-like domain-containing protein n=1 Tax=Hemibagrus guttatus TaxID=175788 RepID=A0AAE0UKC4_9TELE|nr:hypothetical protein QTP70_007945 [Hemibagrus guttatus]
MSSIFLKPNVLSQVKSGSGENSEVHGSKKLSSWISFFMWTEYPPILRASLGTELHCSLAKASLGIKAGYTLDRVPTITSTHSRQFRDANQPTMHVFGNPRGEDSFELHSVDLELEAVEKQIRDLQVKQAQLQQRKAALESPSARTRTAQVSFTPAPGYHAAWMQQQRKTRAKPRARTSPPPPPPVFEISTQNRFAPLRETECDAVIIGDSIVRHVPAILKKNIGAVVLHAGTNNIRLRQTEILKKDFRSLVEKPFRGGLAGVFWIIVLLQNPSSLQLEVTNLPIYQCGKDYKVISKALGLLRTTVRAIIYKWRKHGTVENIPRSGRPTKITPRAQRQLIQEVTKDPTTTSKELQASLASVKVSVHDCTIRKRLGKNGLHSRVPKRKPLLSKKNIKARLSFARKHLDDPQDFWDIICGLTRQKLNFLEGPGSLAVINGTMNSAVYQKILKENVRPSVCDLKLKRTWVLQQDNDPKHTSKSTSEWLKKNKMKTLEWPSQSPDLKPIEMLWHDLKKVVHARKPSNVAELQQFCKDEWAKIPPQRCNRLIASYGKRLIAVVAAKGGPTSY